MNLVNCINESQIFLYINNIFDILIGLILCLFSCKCNEKVLAFFIGIHGGFWTGVIIEVMLWKNSWLIGGLLGACFLGMCSLKSQRCKRLITIFVTVSKCLFWILICSAQNVGTYDENVKIFCFSAIIGVLCGILSELFYSSEELIMSCHVLLGTGLIGGVISNLVCDPRYEYFGDIFNNKSELLEYISFFYKMNFWDDGHLIYLIFFCFVGMECQIIMKIREKKKQ